MAPTFAAQGIYSPDSQPHYCPAVWDFYTWPRDCFIQKQRKHFSLNYTSDNLLVIITFTVCAKKLAISFPKLQFCWIYPARFGVFCLWWGFFSFIVCFLWSCEILGNLNNRRMKTWLEFEWQACFFKKVKENTVSVHWRKICLKQCTI